MAEQLRSESRWITLENVTAASNMAAGTLVALSGQAYTLASGTTGYGATATLGYNFIGILDDDVSAGQCPVTVLTQGVFEMQLNSAAVDANVEPGHPVWVQSGAGLVSTPGSTGDACIGTLVGAQTWATTGMQWVQVAIRPMALEWTVSVPGVTGTCAIGGGYPQNTY